jgi:cytochrome c553
MSALVRWIAFTVILTLNLPLPALAQQDVRKVEFFEKQVRPILAEHCYKCHGTPGKPHKGMLNLADRTAAFAGGSSGPAIIPGSPEKSLLIQSLGHEGEIRMPPKGKLSAQQIADLTRWVKDGAVWPDQASAAGSVQGYTQAQKDHWAFRPIRDPSLPTVGGPQSANPIDLFIESRLQAAHIQAAPPAERRVLIRRVTFDLTGLPPTPAEIEAFIADGSPGAWEKVVDRLLASSAYGERWGRHWLDVARYADSNGLDENTAFANAWRYRDYVIRSFDRDKPFDRFIREQIAGDLLPDGGTDGLIATGFLVLGPKLLAEPDKQKMVMDIVDEQIDVVSKAFLGLTVSCARCHDHKFDPIPTLDYYSLAGIFKSTKTMATLNTVARAHERPLPDENSAEMLAYRAEVEQLRREVKRLEREFGSVPVSDRVRRQEIHEAAELRRSEIKRLEPQAGGSGMCLAVSDESTPADIKVHVRGNTQTLGDLAPRKFPRIIAGDKQPAIPARASGRLQLADWIASPDNPLTARVIVNRVWQHHFGEGLVRTPDNFGSLGERPTHPELLDWLASRFIEDGWSLKKLHRRILLSAVYQRSSRGQPSQGDPENRLLARFERRRLEAEAIRDAMLFVAGTLDRTAGGSRLDNGNFEYVTNDQSHTRTRYDAPCRSIYLPVIRNNVYDFFQAFDFVEPHVPTGKRDSTVVAPQALFMMNNPLVVAQSRRFAESLLAAADTDEKRIETAYQRAFGRAPRPDEVSRTIGFLQRYQEGLAETDKANRRLAAWQAFCQVLFASSEFITIE